MYILYFIGKSSWEINYNIAKPSYGNFLFALATINIHDRKLQGYDHMTRAVCVMVTGDIVKCI